MDTCAYSVFEVFPRAYWVRALKRCWAVVRSFTVIVFPLNRVLMVSFVFLGSKTTELLWHRQACSYFEWHYVLAT